MAAKTHNNRETVRDMRALLRQHRQNLLDRAIELQLNTIDIRGAVHDWLDDQERSQPIRLRDEHIELKLTS